MPDVLDAGIDVLLGKVRFLLWGEGGLTWVFYNFFAKKVVPPHTSWNGLLHDPSEIPP